MLFRSKLDYQQLNNGLFAVLVLLGSLVGSMALMAKVMDSVTSNKTSLDGLVKMSASLILVAVAINLLASAVKALAKIEWTELIKGLGAVITLLAALAGYQYLLSKIDGLKKTGLEMLVLAAGAIAPTNSKKPLANDLTTVHTIWNTANIPAKVRLRLSSVSLLGFIASVKFLIPSVMFFKVLAVMGGNTELQALFTVLMIDVRVLKALLTESIISFRPPISINDLTMAFRASDESLIILLKTSETLVHISRASSKSPKRYCQV